MSVVASAASRMMFAMVRTASMLMPARVEATFTLEQTRSVVASADGMEAMRRRSALPAPFCTSAEKPPMKSMPSVLAARSMACATGVRSSSVVAAATWAMGVTDTRLLTMGMPYSRSRSPATSTSPSAVVVILS